MVALAAAAVVWTGCEHKPVRRPAALMVACGDANFYVTRLRWQSWGGASASASGTAHVNDCKPNCAAGHFHAFPVTVRLSKIAVCVRGRREYTRIAWRGPQAGYETLPCRFLRLTP